MRQMSLLGGIAAAALVLGSFVAAHAQTDKPTWLAQNWSSADRTMFYTTSQGSQIMPYEWFMAVERPDSDTLFRADGLARFGYLPNPDKTHNPDALPIGFVKDTDDRGDWIGMTCAACHTNQINFAGKTLQIDGAPSDADMWALISELGDALAKTSASQTDAKFTRFASRVRALNPGQPPASDSKLYADLKEFSEEFTKFVNSSESDVAWGRARLDAFGMIFNRATGIDLNDWGNTHSPNAPVSYPFLWDTHWHNVVQWNGSAPNVLAIERLARNVGEVLGVFAHTDIKRTILPPLYFKTSANRINQLLIENKLSQLRSPQWPQNLAPIDQTKAAAGQKLYASLKCNTCHAITLRNKSLGPITVTMTPISEVDTDPKMATNARDLMSMSGILDGVEMPILVPPALPANGPSFQLTGKIVIGAILAPPDWDALPPGLDSDTKNLLNSIKLLSPPTGGLLSQIKTTKAKLDLLTKSKLWGDAKTLTEKKTTNVDALSYKARPLDGIWATAPYLHNGSVPSLYQLLLPAKDRAKTFHVGTREFDPVNVGFKTDAAPGSFSFDTSLPGNSNAGHDSYGTDKLTDEQRWQLVEYLKTL